VDELLVVLALLPVVVEPAVVEPLLVELPVLVELAALVDVPAPLVVDVVPLEVEPPSVFTGDESSPRLPHASSVRATAPTITPERVRLIVSILTSDMAARFLRRKAK
jgi:hypothetical protein